MAETAGVILAAGWGKRMRSSTPKVLHRLAGQPMIAYVVGACRDAGVGRLVAVVGHGADEVREALPADVETATQTALRGTADAVKAARERLAGDPSVGAVLVTNGDGALVTAERLRALIERRQATGAAVALLVSPTDDPHGYGRVVRQADGQVERIVEQADATEAERQIREINAGIYCFEATWLWGRLDAVQPAATGEYYLPDLIAVANGEGRLVQSLVAPLTETGGVNDRAQLAAADRIVRDRIRLGLMQSGVTMIDPATTYIDVGVAVGPETVLYPGTVLEGRTSVGAGCRIGPYAHLVDAQIGDRVVVSMSVVEQASVAAGARIGPFSHLRPGAQIMEDVEIGNFAEVKNARVGARTKQHHFSYLGDAEVGEDVNVAAGTITCNYDAETGRKSRTVIEDGASLGSDTLLVAPVRIGRAALTGAGAVVTRDVPAEQLVVGVPARPLRRRRRPGAPETVTPHLPNSDTEPKPGQTEAPPDGRLERAPEIGGG